VIAATTPAGSRTISELPTSSSHSISSTRSAIEANVIDGRPTWIIRDSPIGIPSSLVIRAASSSPRASSSAAIAAQ
jgi:hypothetical protein